VAAWQVKLCDPSFTRAIPEHFEFLMTKRLYANLQLLYYILIIVSNILTYHDEIHSPPQKKNIVVLTFA